MREGLRPNRAADVVDEDVDAPKTLLRLGHDPAGIAVLLQIGQDCDRVGPGRCNLLMGLVDHLGAVDERNLAAFLRQVHRNHPADALRRPGHDGNLALEAIGMVHHDSTAPMAVTTPLFANFSK